VTMTGSEVDVVGAFALHRVSLIRLAALLVDDRATAEDVVQDAFVALHRHRGQLRDDQALFAYLRKAVVNNAHNVWRRRTVVRRAHPAPPVPAAAGADEPLLVAEEQARVFAAVRTLPTRQREVVVLRYWSGLSEAEIADALGISRGAVKSHASRAMAKLEATLGASR
jgi:RNA polymerase sigma-70 factor (sigma-E family)